MDEKEKSWDLNFLANGDEEKYCIHKAGGTTPVKYRLEADILTLTADNNNNNNKIEKKNETGTYNYFNLWHSAASWPHSASKLLPFLSFLKKNITLERIKNKESIL